MRFRPRVIPVLLLSNGGLVKTTSFKRPVYLGDPVNAVRVFNDKGVDELMLLDIDASRRSAPTPFELLAEIASEAFMPVGCGGGIRSLDDIESRLSLGFEKVVIGTAAHRIDFIEAAARRFGSSTITTCIDVRRRRLLGPEVLTKGGAMRIGSDPIGVARRLADAGAGEIVLQSVDRDGAMSGYDLDLIRDVAESVDIPIVALGGAGSEADLRRAVVEGRAAAAAAGAMFVYQGRHRAVLINYPDELFLDHLFSEVTAP